MLILRWVTVALRWHSAHKTKQLVTNKLTHMLNESQTNSFDFTESRYGFWFYKLLN